MHGCAVDVELAVSVALSPQLMMLGDALVETVGGAVTDNTPAFDDTTELALYKIFIAPLAP